MTTIPVICIEEGNMKLNFVPVLSYFDGILAGLWWTIVLAVGAGIICVFGGIFIATFINYTNRIVSAPLRFFIWLFMGTPLLLQLWLLYHGWAQLNILLPAMFIGIFGLGLHYAAYNADVYRAALNTISHGQYEAARSLGFGHLRTIFLIIIPQAMYRSIPQFGNNLIIMVKDTSILSIIGISEMVLAAQYAISVTYRPFEFYITVALIFYAINLILESLLNLYEKKSAIKL